MELSQFNWPQGVTLGLLSSTGSGPRWAGKPETHEFHNHTRPSVLKDGDRRDLETVRGEDGGSSMQPGRAAGCCGRGILFGGRRRRLAELMR